MASSSGRETSSGSSTIQNSGSEEDVEAQMDQRKRKRMTSNRESARKYRMRKQRHLEGLVATVAQLKNENQRISQSINIANQRMKNSEIDNSVLRAEMTKKVRSSVGWRHFVKLPASQGL
ncbi:hypothetical protein LR48_Vigan661s000800 [Vigna angularis]|uniref:BZIP domain-containing protein n=1 Tax=Phaseolus angularis TaxID=3914 RepID=A0A0L9TFY6_PHAAN|nr:hypothetical protein LR48_Vigan661s000800 [Vigna angularis]